MIEDKYKAIMESLSTFKYKRDVLQVFKDCIEYLALQIAISVDPYTKKENKDRFPKIFEEYDEQDKQNVFKVVEQIKDLLKEFENNLDDYLGNLYMRVVGEYGKVNLSQYFTPYHISKLMAEMTIDEDEYKNARKPIGMNDPCCGAGGLCIAYLDVLKENRINYLNKAIVYANDVDKTCTYMTYLQLSFAGAAAIVEHKNTLTQENFDTFRTLGYFVQQLEQKGVME